MKKIYFAIVFSVVLFLLFPGMRAYAENKITYQTDFRYFLPESIQTFSCTEADTFSYSIQHGDSYHYVLFSYGKNRVTYTRQTFDKNNNLTSSSDFVQDLDCFSDFPGIFYSDVIPVNSSYFQNSADIIFDSSESFLISLHKLIGSISEGNDPLYVPPTYSPDYSGLGYLTGMEDFYKELEIRNETGGLTTGNVQDKTFHFGWNRLTSTGLDIFMNDYEDSYVEVALSSVISRPLKNGTIYYSSSNGKLHQLDKLRNTYSFDYKYSDALSLFADGLEEARNAQGFFDDLLTSGYSQPSLKLYYYFRVVVQDSSGNFTYGPWLRMNPDKTFDKYNANSSPGSSIVVGITDENDNFIVSSDSEYGEGDHLTGGYGSGWNWEDAAIDSNKNKVVVHSYAQNSEDLVNMVNSIPNLIQVVFSFFPPWVLGLFSLLFASIVPLVIIKLVT